MGEQRQILTAEDNPALSSVIRFNLERCGYKVSIARNGREAWEQLEAGESFDLLITDHQMPEMTGCELCQRIRADDRFRHLPVIMLTAKGLELELPKLRDELGVLAVFAKPFSPVELVMAVQQELAPATTE